MADQESLFTTERPEDQGLPFTARDATRLFFKHKGLILLCFVTMTALVAAGLACVPVSYQADAKVLIKTELQVTPSFFSGIAAYREPPLSDPAGRRIETEMELVETMPLSEEVVRTLDLKYDQVYHKPYVYLLNPVGDVLDKVLEVFGYPPDPDKYGFAATAEAFRKSVVVKPIKSKSAEATSNIIEVTVTSVSPDIAQQALETLLAAYTNYDTTLNRQAGEKAYNIVKRQLHDTEIEVKRAQDRLRKFLLDKASPASPRAGTTTFAKTDPSLTTPAPVDSLVTSPRDQTSISLLKTRLIELEMERLDLQKTFQGESERTRLLGSTIATLQQRLAKEIRNDAENDVTLATLERDVRSIETEHNDIDKKLAQIAFFLKMNEQQIGNRVVVEPPVKPRSSDKKKKIAVGLFGSIAGLLVGLALAGLREYADHTLSSARDVRKFLGLEVLTSIPKASAEEIAGGGLGLIFSRLGLRIASLLGQRAAGRTGQPVSLLVTSIQPGEGVTFVSRALAEAMATHTEHRVLLVESGYDEKAVPEKRSATLSVLPGSPAPGDRALPAKKVNAFLRSLSDGFDVVVFDGAALSACGADARPYVSDGVLLVVDSESCRREVAQSVLEQIDVPAGQWVGAVLNKKVRYIPSALYRRL